MEGKDSFLGMRPTRIPLAHSELTSRIIGHFFDVYNDLGYGFPEKIYHRALKVALAADGILAASEVSLPVWFRGQVIGRFRADLVVEELVVVELKTLPMLYPANATQLLNYLKSTKREVGLLLNFGRQPQIKRLVRSNPPDPRASA